MKQFMETFFRVFRKKLNEVGSESFASALSNLPIHIIIFCVICIPISFVIKGLWNVYILDLLVGASSLDFYGAFKMCLVIYIFGMLASFARMVERRQEIADKTDYDSKVCKLLVEGLKTDGEHHKQWFMEESLKALGYPAEAVGVGAWEEGTPP